jgi:uncharacterized membrane protein YfcA
LAALCVLGGGGSILMVPLLTYVGDLDAGQATATSLLVVGATSATRAISHARAVRWGVAAAECLMCIATSVGCKRFELYPRR